jgi:putative YphP/YqiW family bacilliredoxin
MYPEEMVAPMRQELVQAGFKEWRSAAEVDRDLAATKGVALVVINSVCGCSAASCRPGVALAMEAGPKPDYAYTAFAGNDVEAVAQVREYLLGEPPSSPSMGIFKDGKFHGMIHRKDIQGRHPTEIAALVQGAIAAAKAG